MNVASQNSRKATKGDASSRSLPPVSLTINGAEVHAHRGMTILTAAEEAGISIPHLCAYPGLSPFERCRLCVVEVEGVRGFPTACTMEVQDGMVVTTETEAIQSLRRTSLELLLTEHPTGCLLCDYQTACLDHHGCTRRAGVVTGCRFCPKDQTCELQRVVKEVGLRNVTLPVHYRGLPIERRDPFIERDDNLCILCARCVRVCDEVRGSGAISTIYRGSKSLVGTGYHRPLIEVGCQFCGACVDVCPTGSLVERANKWEGRGDRSVTTTCPYCSLGCPVRLDIKDERVIRSRPTDDGLIRGEICVKGRFCVTEFVNHHERLGSPFLRRGGRLVKVGWDEALKVVVERLRRAGGDRFALLTTPNATNEDLYIGRKFTEVVMHSDQIMTANEWRVDEAFPEVTAYLQDIEQAATILTVCTETRYSYTPVQTAILRALRRGGQHVGIEPFTHDLRHVSSYWMTPRPGTEIFILLSILRIVIDEGVSVHDDGKVRETLRRALAPYTPEMCGRTADIPAGVIVEAARRLVEKTPTVLIWGASLLRLSCGVDCVEALQHIASTIEGKILPLLDGNNVRGAHTLGIGTGLPPSWTGDTVLFSLGQPTFEERPDVDLLIVHDLFSPDVEADVVLPATAFTEEDGTVIDITGTTRSINLAVPPFGASKPGWWVLCEVAKRLGVEGFDFEGPEAIREEMIEELSAEPVSARSRWIPGPPERLVMKKADEDWIRHVHQYNPFIFRNNAIGRYVPGVSLIKDYLQLCIRSFNVK
jgi:predicted molibdopterin-dependent oxidoreductase YjgC